MCLAIPGKIMRIWEEDSLMRMGKVSFGGILKEVNLAYVPEANIGDYVIVHVGFAISRVEEKEAERVFEYLREMKEIGSPSSAETSVLPPHPGPLPARGRGEKR